MAAVTDPRAFASNDDIYQRIHKLETTMPKAQHMPVRDEALGTIRQLDEHRAWVSAKWDELPEDAKDRLAQLAYELSEIGLAKRRSLIERFRQFWWRMQYLREWDQDPGLFATSLQVVRSADEFVETILSLIERDHPAYADDLATAITRGRDDSQQRTVITPDNLDDYLARLMDD